MEGADTEFAADDGVAPRAFDLPLVLVIASGGGLGSVARWGVGQALASVGAAADWSTPAVNVLGSLGIGVLLAVLGARPAGHRYLRAFLGVGVLGGLTTFSTYILQADLLAADGQVPLALVQLAGTVLVGLSAVAVGSAVGRRLASVPQAPTAPR